MANPSKYTQGYDFSGFQDGNPATPLPADRLDTELANISASTEELRDAVMDVRRADGGLKNRIVTRESLSSNLLALTGADTGDWLTGTNYVVGDLATSGGRQYQCIVAHTAGVFATDLAAGKWALTAAESSEDAAESAEEAAASAAAAAAIVEDADDAVQLASQIATPQKFGALGDSVDDSAAFTAMMASRPSAIFISGGNFYIDPVEIDFPCHITVTPDATISQRTTGVSGPAYTVATGQVITRQALFKFVAGSEGSVMEGGGWFDGRRASVASFVDEYRSKWDGVWIDTDNVTVRDIKAKNFNTFGFANEGNHSALINCYVKDSGQGVFCGVYNGNDVGGLSGEGRSGQVLRDVTVENIDNDGASVYQHAIDIMFSHRGEFAGLRIIDQGGDTSGKSATASGLSVVGCRHSVFSGLAHDGFTTTTLSHLAVSFVGNHACAVSGLLVEGLGAPSVSAIGLEDISNFNCAFADYVIDGEYLGLDAGSTIGVNFNVGAQYPEYNRGRRRSLISSRSQHVNGRILRTSIGYYVRAQKPKLIGCSVIGPSVNGVYISDWELSNSFGDPPDGRPNTLEIDGLTISNAGEAGVNFDAYQSVSISDTLVRNPGQTLAGTTQQRSAINLTPSESSGRVALVNVRAEDDQGDTISANATFDPTQTPGAGSTASFSRIVVTLLDSTKFDYFQRVRLEGAAGSGTDIDGWVVDYDNDEFTIEVPVASVLSATGNTTNLSGTWTTDGTDATQINGSSGALSTELTGAFWVTTTAGANSGTYRQIIVNSGNNTAYLNEAFPNALSGNTLRYVRVDTTRGPSGAASMQIGFRLSLANVASIFTNGLSAVGATSQDWLTNSHDKFEQGSEYQYETAKTGVTTSASPVDLLTAIPAHHSIVGASWKVVTILAGAALTTWSLLVRSTAGTTLETVASALAIAASTIGKSAVTAQSRNNGATAGGTVRKISASADAGTLSTGALAVKVLVRVDAPDSY